MDITLHHQVSGETEEIVARLKRLLATDGLLEVRFSVAYARWDGIGLIAHLIEKLLAKGGRFETVYGAANGVTTSDALYYGIMLDKMYPGQTYSGFIEDVFQNAIFHPKFYEFRFADRIVALIGSANLTGGGLARNGELVVELSCKPNEPLGIDLSTFWKAVKKGSKEVTVPEIGRLAKAPGAGAEGRGESGTEQSGKPFLKVKSKLAPKPIFRKVLDLPKSNKKEKSSLLAGMNSLTNRPKNLYLQIFERETGGQKGKSGSAVQLPVATLGAYFGLAEGEQRVVTFRFPGETFDARVIHNSNHTHQVRLNPIFSVKRPAIIHFVRVGENIYEAKFVPPAAYHRMLKSKCTQQSRAGSRRWGLE